MPIIREYNQQLNAPNRPISQSADPRAAGAAYRGMQALGEGIQDLGKDVFDVAEQHEQANLQVDLAKARADLTAKMQRAKETGEASDPEYVKYATEAAQEISAQLAEKMTTRRGMNTARVMGSQLSASVQTQAIHDNASAIGEQAKLTALETQNINRMTLASSPQQFTAVLGETRQYIDSLTNIDANLRQRMLIEAEDGLATAAIQGVIRTRSPEEAKQILDARQMDGFLLADSKKSLYAEADQAIRAREAEAIRLEAHQKRLEEKEHQEIGKDFVAKMNSPNGNQLSTKEILASKLPWQTKEHFIKALSEGSSAKADPRTVNELIRRIHLPDADPRKISHDAQLLAYVGRGLDLKALNDVRREFDEVRDPSNQPLNDVRKTMLNSVKSQIAKSTMFAADPAGEEQFYKYQQYVALRVQQTREASEDVFDLFDPRNQNYLGSKDVLQQFQRSPQEQMADMAERMKRGNQKSEIAWPGGKPPERQPGETPAQYLERLKKAGK
jgi:hypothetical protein